METNELLISLLISVSLFSLLFAWVFCLQGCERLVRWHIAGRQERQQNRLKLQPAQEDVLRAESIA